jgi:hypothetical protein
MNPLADTNESYRKVDRADYEAPELLELGEAEDLILGGSHGAYSEWNIVWNKSSYA